MVYFATASLKGNNLTSPESQRLFGGHAYEGSPGGYLITPDKDSAMEAAILMMGLLLEITNTAPHNAFDGLLVIYQANMQDPEPEEHLAFEVNLKKITQAAHI